MKRIVLFVLTNIAVLLVLSIVLRVFGLDRALAAQGINYGSLLVFSAVIGFSGLSLVAMAVNESPWWPAASAPWHGHSHFG